MSVISVRNISTARSISVRKCQYSKIDTSTEIVRTVLAFLTETVLTVRILCTEIALTALTFLPETVLTVLAFRTEIVLPVLTFLLKSFA